MKLYDYVALFLAFVLGTAAIVALFALDGALKDVKEENAALRAERDRLVEIVLRDSDGVRLVEPVLSRDSVEEPRASRNL